MDKLNGRKAPLQRALKISFAYLLVGVLWITLSDAILAGWVADPSMLSQLQTYKGWAFVMLTGLALFAVVYRQLRRDRSLLSWQDQQSQEIRKLSQFQHGVIENASVWINVLDRNARIVLWNKAAESISGYSASDVTGRDDVWELFYPDPDYRRHIATVVEEILNTSQELKGYETRIRTRSGEERLISWDSQRFDDDQGRMAGSIAIGRDVTEQRLAERALLRSQSQLQNLMDNLPGMAYRCLYDEFWTMKFVSSGCRELTGYAPEALVENREVAFASLMHAEDNDKAVQRVEGALASAESFSIEYRLNRRNGHQIWVWERGRAVEEEGELVLEGIILDITDRKRLEHELSELATRDTLTGLYNRREMTRLMEEEIQRAQRYRRHLAVLWIDLDHFKAVNDEYGHSVGDEVLIAVCNRLGERIRAQDALGRYGGEEFIMLLPEMDAAGAMETANRLRACVAGEAIALRQGRELSLTVSIGVAVFPDHGSTAELLSDAADRAMYEAKRDGRNQVSLAGAQLAGETR